MNVLNNNDFGGAIIRLQHILFFALMLAPILSISVMNVHADTLPTPMFDGAPEESSSSGQISLRWRLQDPDADPSEFLYHVEMAESAEFTDATTWYSGEDLATYLSGLPDGEFYFRVRASEFESDRTGAWSEPKQVTVQHHSLTFALTLCALGALVFFSTVAVIVHGTLRTDESADTGDVQNTAS